MPWVGWFASAGPRPVELVGLPSGSQRQVVLPVGRRRGDVGDSDGVHGEMIGLMGFTPEQVRYLESLPAVRCVRNGRIRYTGRFRDECMRRYAAGERPTAIFREAGLPPELVGYKRIERAFARWREAGHMRALPAGRPQDMVRALPFLLSDKDTDVASDVTEDAAGVTSGTSAADSVSVAQSAAPDTSGERVRDSRDLLIIQQMHYIQYLERELGRMSSSAGQDK